MELKPLPCPLCGNPFIKIYYNGTDICDGGNGEDWHFNCGSFTFENTNIGCHTNFKFPYPIVRSRDEAIKKWNRRRADNSSCEVE